MLNDKDSTVRRRVSQALISIAEPKALKLMWQRQAESPYPDLYYTIQGIQNRCKFYNYEVFQEAKTVPLDDDILTPPSPNTINAEVVQIIETNQPGGNIIGKQ